MTTEIEAIVLTAVRFSDTAYMIHVYSDLFGSLSLRASRPAGRKTAGGARALFIPLSVIRTTIDYRSTREVFIPRGTTIVQLLSAPSIDPSANALALFATELLHRLLRSASPDRALYGYLRESLADLDRISDTARASWHLRLMTGLCHHLGILPRYDAIAQVMSSICRRGSSVHRGAEAKGQKRAGRSSSTASSPSPTRSLSRSPGGAK